MKTLPPRGGGGSAPKKNGKGIGILGRGNPSVGCDNHSRTNGYGNRFQYNLVSETLILLDVICGSTTGGLGLLGLYINENNVSLINQILETLTEYCQVKLQPFRRG